MRMGTGEDFEEAMAGSNAVFYKSRFTTGQQVSVHLAAGLSDITQPIPIGGHFKGGCRVSAPGHSQFDSVINLLVTGAPAEGSREGILDFVTAWVVHSFKKLGDGHEHGASAVAALHNAGIHECGLQAR